MKMTLIGRALCPAGLVLALLAAGCARREVAAPPLPPQVAPAAASRPPAAGRAESAAHAAIVRQLKAKQARVTSYTVRAEGLPDELEMSVELRAGQPQRLHIGASGPRGAVLIDVPAHTLYLIQTAKKTITKSPFDPGLLTQMPASISESLIALLADDPLLTAAKLDGKPTWRAVTGAGDEQAITHFDQATGLPLQTSAQGKTLRLRYRRVNAVPAKVFALPTGYTTVEVPLALPSVQ